MAERNMMFTYGTRARAKCYCAFKCNFPDILQGEPIIRTQMRFANSGNVSQKTYHPLCWLDQTLAYIETLPVVHTQRGMSGRPRIIHSTEQRKARTKLSTRMYRIRADKEFAISRGWWWKVEMLDEQVKAIRAEYMTLGGIPSTWPD